MNKFEGIGRATKDPDVRYTQGENSMCMARFTLACDRRGKKDGNQPSADFLPCVAFGKTAEFIEKYVTKGTKLGVVGHIQTGSYTNKEGQKIYTTDIAIEEVEFAESKGSGNSGSNQGNQANQGNSAPAKSSGDGFMNIPDGLDEIEGLPFN